MAETSSLHPERRCASCSAILYEGAGWCGMCFAPVPSAPPAPDAASGAAGRAITTTGSAARTPMWPCPVCEGRNPIELDVCATCGTPFAVLMREERSRPSVDRRDALRRSLLFPGLGHRKVGRELDGFARGALFTMLAITTLMLALSGVASGSARMLFLVYASATVAVYLMTAFEAGRLASGGDLIVSSRVLLWTTVAIVMLSVVMVPLVIGTATRR